MFPAINYLASGRRRSARFESASLLYTTLEGARGRDTCGIVRKSCGERPSCDHRFLLPYCGGGTSLPTQSALVAQEGRLGWRERASRPLVYFPCLCCTSRGASRPCPGAILGPFGDGSMRSGHKPSEALMMKPSCSPFRGEMRRERRRRGKLVTSSRIFKEARRCPSFCTMVESDNATLPTS